MSIRPIPAPTPAGTSGQLSVVAAGSDLTTARPDVPVAYWKFDGGTDVGDAGVSIVNGEPGDLFFVAGVEASGATPANLHYAFAGHNSGNEDVQVVAYVVVGTPFVDNPGGAELDTSLVAGFDYSSTAGDGNGSVGQYVVYSWLPSVEEPIAASAASYGFNPFDPANQVVPAPGAFGAIGAV